MTQTILLMLIYAHHFQVIKHSIKTSFPFVFFTSHLHHHTGKCQWGEVLAVPSQPQAWDMHSPLYTPREEEEDEDVSLTLPCRPGLE